jgi:hypothetical protein
MHRPLALPTKPTLSAWFLFPAMGASAWLRCAALSSSSRPLDLTKRNRDSNGKKIALAGTRTRVTSLEGLDNTLIPRVLNLETNPEVPIYILGMALHPFLPQPRLPQNNWQLHTFSQDRPFLLAPRSQPPTPTNAPPPHKDADHSPRSH